MKIEIFGIDDIITSIEALGDINDLEDGMELATLAVERQAKLNAPKETGVLRDSITSKVESSGTTIEGTIYTTLDYAPYVEYGTGLFAESGGRKDVPWYYKDFKGDWHSTSGMKPQPYLRPALRQAKDEVVQAIKSKIGAK